MTLKTETFLNQLAKTSLNYYDFIQKSNNIDEISSFIDVKDLNAWKMLGVEIEKTFNNKFSLATRFKNISEQVFCVVDIETSGGINKGQVIELGAVKILNNQIIDSFESLIYAKEVPLNISEITGITTADLKNAPKIKEVMEKFKLFLKDDVFVAHNVKFDFNYLSFTFEKLGYGTLLNRNLCTIDLARRTIPSNKYGLSSLKELLNINNAHHRAFNDALAASEVFKESLKRIPTSVQSVEDLILFSKKAKSLKVVDKVY